MPIKLPTEKELGILLYNWRMANDYSTREAAQKIGLAHMVYYRAECGQRCRSDHYRKLVRAIRAY